MSRSISLETWRHLHRGGLGSTQGSLNGVVIQVAAELSSPKELLDPRFRRAVASFLDQEREMVAQKIEHLAEYSPFRHETNRADED